uniref:Ig-like domain-containing protein n=1 Tax=Trichobilharzia regenti TaxID=157069 RepID=A0AA85J9D0_TRIRE|nr:unnamed protein product [Trichobilharzia regenti]
MVIHCKSSLNTILIIVFNIFLSRWNYFSITTCGGLLCLSSFLYSTESKYNQYHYYYYSSSNSSTALPPSSSSSSSTQQPVDSYLRGPENQSVLYNTNTIMHCRVYNRNYNISTKLKAFYEHYLSVQWIIDGFGVNNESLKAVHGERYSMPGPVEQGNFDLHIKNAQLEDEASFICQANIKIYSNSGSPPYLDTITSKPAYLTVIYPPSELTLMRVSHSSSDKRGQILHGANSVNMMSNTHLPNYAGDSHHEYSTEDPLDPLIDQDLSRIVADDPEIESSYVYNKNFVHPGNQPSDLQSTPQINSLKTIATSQVSSIQSEDTTPQLTPKLWIPENKQLIVACRTSPSKPVTTIQWHLAGTLLFKNPGLSEYFIGVGRPQLNDTESQYFSNNQNHPIQYSIEEKILNVSDKLLTMQKDDKLTHGSEVVENDSHEKNLTDEILMQITHSQLTLLVQRRFQGWQLDCGVSNSEDFMPAKLPTITSILEPMYIESVKIHIINHSEYENFHEGQSVNFECLTKTNPKSPLYSWTIGNSIPSMEYEPLNVILDTRIESKGDADNKHEHSLIALQSDASILQLTVNRAMHQKRLRCWVGIETPDLMHHITNVSLQGFLSNKALTCVSDCRKLKNTLRKRLKNMIWAKGEYRLEVTYGPAFLTPMNDLLSGELGQMLNLECTADSNPESDVSLYHIGPEGQILLEDLTKLELVQYQRHSHMAATLRGQENRLESQHVFWNSEAEVTEFNTTILKSVIYSSGRKLLASKVKHVSYKLHLSTHLHFGFYACVAQSRGYPPIYRAIYVGQAASPKIVKTDQIIGYDENSAKLFCLVYSIPRPTVHQIMWSKNGVVLKPDKRLLIYQEKTHRGVKSVLVFRKLRSTDFSTYNCTVFNDYGSDWRLISLTDDSKWSLTFAIGSGLAALLATVFVTVICCFIKYARMRRINSKNRLKFFEGSTVQKNNGSEDVHNDMELQTMLGSKSPQSAVLGSNYNENINMNTSKNEYYPIHSQYKSDIGTLTNDSGILKYTSYDLNQTHRSDTNTDFIKENYTNYPSDANSGSSPLPFSHLYLSPVKPPLPSSLNSTTGSYHHHDPYCELQQQVNAQMNSIVNTLSPLNTPDYPMNIISSLKHSDITPLVHTNSLARGSTHMENSACSQQTTFSNETSSSSPLGPIFLMTSDINYPPGMHYSTANSTTTTVLLPPVVFEATNDQSVLCNPYNSLCSNTSVVLNTNNNNNDISVASDISFLPFSVNNVNQQQT